MCAALRPLSSVKTVGLYPSGSSSARDNTQRSMSAWVVTHVPSGSWAAGKACSSIQRRIVQRLRWKAAPMASSPTRIGRAGVGCVADLMCFSG